ncbi:hypothetical protein OG883_30805 [Streptomyces sp. NBC_01142]|uniref:hypothetical protein n=1 Tax=Streptomyces sp. NBC_01142 TaxID=2975865 RepID=UPI002252F756|nr:hypothetical protein [Streptomyces sp. NBC_01142]MCX4824172.1 hypothetical protein [Streptomyces sp. NBC_01142]
MRTSGIPVPPALVGFVLLVLALTAVSYGVGRAVGPVAPGLHRVEDPAGPGDGDPGGPGGMPGMHGMRESR